jgi:formate hydrogenlyase subunit 4
MSFAVFAEPALLLCILVFATLAGTSNLDAIATLFREGQLGLRVSLLFAALALVRWPWPRTPACPWITPRRIWS